jgi:hypothetical protein
MRTLRRVSALTLILLLCATALLASKTYSFTVTNTGTGIAVVTRGECSSVTVYENTATPTTSFEVRAPLTSDSALVQPSGGRFTFTTPGNKFSAGYTVGYVRAIDVASVAFAQKEN